MWLNRKINIFLPLYFTISVSIILVMYVISIHTRSLSPLLEYDCLYLVATLIIVIKQFGIFSIFNIFFITSFFFLYDCLFFTLIGSHNFLMQTFPTKYFISTEGGQLFLVAVFLFVLFSYTGYSFFVCNNHKKFFSCVFNSISYKDIYTNKIFKISGICCYIFGRVKRETVW